MKNLIEAQEFALAHFKDLLENPKYPQSQRDSTRELIETCVKCGWKFAEKQFKIAK